MQEMCSRKILIVGANGAVGRTILHQLLSLPRPPGIRVSTRNTTTVNFPPGVEVVQGDLTDPSSYRRIFAGIDRAFLYSTPDAPLEQLFSAAQAEGLQHVTLLSSLSVEDDPQGILGTAQRKVEDRIINSGLLYTFIRAGNFCSNVSLFWMPQLEKLGKLWLTYPYARSAPVSEVDIAAVAVIALTTDRFSNQAIGVTGPEWVTHGEQIDAINRLRQTEGKRPFDYAVVTPEIWKIKTSLFIPSELQDQLLKFWILGEKKMLAFRPSQKITGSPSQCFGEWLTYNKAAFLQ